MLLGSELKDKLILDEAIYKLPKYQPVTTGEIAIEYATFRYENEEMARLSKKYLRKKKDKYDIGVLNNYVTLNQDTFDASSVVGESLIKLNAYLISTQKEINGADDLEKIKAIADNVKKEYEKFINLLNNNTRGIVDAIIWYSIGGDLAYPIHDSELRDVLSLSLKLKSAYPNSLKYIIYD